MSSAWDKTLGNRPFILRPHDFVGSSMRIVSIILGEKAQGIGQSLGELTGGWQMENRLLLLPEQWT